LVVRIELNRCLVDGLRVEIDLREHLLGNGIVNIPIQNRRHLISSLEEMVVIDWKIRSDARIEPLRNS